MRYGRIGKNFIDNLSPLYGTSPYKTILCVMEKAGEGLGVSVGVWECGKPARFSSISMPRSRGEGRGGFLFKPPKGALFGSPFPPVVPQPVCVMR